MKVFLSYPSEIRATAEPIAFSLRSRGHKVFLDRDDLPAGKSYDDQIQNAVEQSDVFVYLIAPASLEKGRYTLTELEFARRAWRHPAGRVLPVMIESTDLSKVPAFLKGVTILEPQGNIAAEVAAAIEDLQGSGVALKKLMQAAALCGGLTVALMLLLNLLPYFPGLSSINLAVALGSPIALLVYRLTGNLTWRLLAPIPAMLIAFQMALPFFPVSGTKFVSPIYVSATTSEEGEAATEAEKSKRALDDDALTKIEKWNEIVRIADTTLALAVFGAVLMLGVLAGALPILAPWLSVGRCLMCVCVGGGTSIIAGWFGLTLWSFDDVFIGPIAFGLYIALSGASLAYWHAQGRVG